MPRGGKREGAGRPRGSDKRKISLYLPNWLADWLKAEADSRRYSQAKLIEEALVEHFRLNKNAG